MAIVGPTASGKSDLAVRVAKLLYRQGYAGQGEIISADSRQVYKGLDIGTGKVMLKDNLYKGVRHHLIDVASPKGQFSVDRYLKLGNKAIKEILKRGNTPIICGGTGLYVDALLYGANYPEVKPNKELRMKLEKESTEELYKKLEELDTERASSIDRHNRRRLVRAIEIVTALGKVPPLSERKLIYPTLKIGVKIEMDELTKKIHKRLVTRVKQGLIKEVEDLHTGGLSWKRLEDLGLEYRWVAYFLHKKIERKTMLENLEKDIVAYAKRQMTWFKRDKEINWIESYAQIVSLLATTNL